jgi:hypothetical protein
MLNCRLSKRSLDCLNCSLELQLRVVPDFGGDDSPPLQHRPKDLPDANRNVGPTAPAADKVSVARCAAQRQREGSRWGVIKGRYKGGGAQ